MLVDDITITITAGHGGAGKVSFGRQMHSGPDGGNGGNGGLNAGDDNKWNDNNDGNDGGNGGSGNTVHTGHADAKGKVFNKVNTIVTRVQ